MQQDTASGVNERQDATGVSPRLFGTTVAKALAYLAEHPDEWLTIAELARRLRVSRWTLQRNAAFRAAWKAREQSKLTGNVKEPSRRMLRTLLSNYIGLRPELKPVSAAQLECSVKAFDRFLERPALLCDLNEETVIRFISWRLQRVSRWATKRNRSNLLTLWRFASRMKLIPSPPVEGVQTVKVAKVNPIAWTLTEISTILAACDTLTGRMFAESDKKRRRWIKAEYTGPLRSQWWAALILFIYDTGTRIGATLEIEPADIELDRGLVTLRSDAAKTGLEQVLRLSPQTVAAIRRIYDPKAKRVWYWGFARAELHRSLGSILEKAGLPSGRNRKFHALRKTTATLAAAAGRRDLAQRSLGHTSAAMTDRYIDARALPVQSAADVLPRPAWGDSTPQTSPETPGVAVADALRELSPDALAALLRLATTLAAAGKAPA